jgi:hypothetical protein
MSIYYLVFILYILLKKTNGFILYFKIFFLL